MNILCFDYSHVDVLRGLGHTVLAAGTEAGLVRLPAFLAGRDFQPDLLIQQERLGRRVFLEGLEDLDCPTLFISVDSHLNMFWQKYYVRLFDLVLTPHLSIFTAWFSGLPGGAAVLDRVRRLRHDGYARTWRDYRSRSHDLSFCGVVDGHRPLRQAMLNLLEGRFALYRPPGLVPRQEMLDIFSDSRVLPNESIAREVNFRVFEGASCGCLVLGQDIGEDQNACFEPGKEVILYEHGLDLLDKCAFFLKNTGAAEAIARAAWTRVQKEHLPERRVQELLDFAKNAVRARAEGEEACKFFYLTLLRLARHGSLRTVTAWLLKRLDAFSADPDGAAGLLTLLAEAGERESTLYCESAGPEYAAAGLTLCRELVRLKLHEDSTSCNLAASFFALLQGQAQLAVLFCLREQKNLLRAADLKTHGRSQASLLAAFSRFQRSEPGQLKAGSFYEFYLLWAEILRYRGRLAQPGFQLRVKRGFMPESALECLLLAQSEIDEADLADGRKVELIRRLHQVCSQLPGYSFLDMGFLAQLSLFNQKSWRLQFDYGLSCLKCLRVETALAELDEAWRTASAQGEQPVYLRLLAAFPASGYIQKILNLPERDRV